LTTRATVNFSSTLIRGDNYLNCTFNYFMKCMSNGQIQYPLHKHHYKG